MLSARRANPGRVKKWKERSRNVPVIQNLLVRREGAGAIALRAANRAVSVPSDSCRPSIAPYQWDKDKCEDKRVGFALKSTCGYQKALSSR